MRSISIFAAILATPCLVLAATPLECATAIKACQDAGYKNRDHDDNNNGDSDDNKGGWSDCIDKIAKGKSVPGVTLTQADAAACKAAQKGGKDK